MSSAEPPGLGPGAVAVNVRRVGAKVDVAEAEFIIENFPATFALMKVPERPHVRELHSGPLLNIRGHLFGFCVGFAAKEGQKVDDTTPLAFWIEKLSKIEVALLFKLRLRLANRNHSFIEMANQDHFMKWSVDATGKGFHYNWKPLVGKRPCPCLGMILDPSSGWLHDGALHITGRLELVREKSLGSSLSLQAPGHSLPSAFKAFLESGQLADLVLKVGTEHLQVHSQILAARSPVFLRMLSSPMREAAEREVVIEDLPFAAVKSLVSAIYTDSIEEGGAEDVQLLIGLLQAAHRFEVESVMQQCTTLLLAAVTVENVVPIFECAALLVLEELKSECLGFIQCNIGAVQSTDAYDDLVERKPKLLKDILSAVAPPQKKARRA